MEALIRSAPLADTRTRLNVRSPGAVPASVEDAQSLHSRLREEIHNEIRAEFMARAQEATEDEREKARAEAYVQGLEQGREAARAEMAQAIAKLDARVEEALALLREAHQSAIEQWQAQVGAVAFAALCKLVGREAGNQFFARSIVEQVCAPLRTETTATARMHPRDVRLLRSLMDGAGLQLGALGLNVVEDESLELGGCVVESSVGVYDGALDTQLKRLHAILTGTAE